VSYRILLVDDDDLLRRGLAFSLEEAGYRVRSAGSAEDGFSLCVEYPPDLVLLDTGLPGTDGLDTLRQFEDQIGVPVILLAGNHRGLDEALALQLGADDYVPRPFDLEVLLARIKAVLRRARRPCSELQDQPLAVGDLVIDAATHTVMVGPRAVDLRPRDFDLLRALAAHAGQILSVDQLLARVWGAEYQGEPQVVYVHIRWLREKLEPDPVHPRRIVSVRGVGYKLEPVQH
jgi:DNA-binding response OmpR family regulator